MAEKDGENCHLSSEITLANFEISRIAVLQELEKNGSKVLDLKLEISDTLS